MVNFAFFGTPEFALPILEGIEEFCNRKHHHLAMVVCQPDRPSGRGRKLAAPPIKEHAAKKNISVFQPATLRFSTKEGKNFYENFCAQKIDIAIVAAYGRIIPKKLLETPSFGFINVHASILPRWRGASPIQHAIFNQDKETGVSIMDLVPELDAGDVYCTKTVTIEPDDDSITLSTKLAYLGKTTLTKALDGILAGTLKKNPQPDSGITFAPTLKKEEGLANFHYTMDQFLARMRAMHPWPGTYSYHNGNLVRLFDASKEPLARYKYEDLQPGTVADAHDSLILKVCDGFISFSEAQLSGRKRLPIRQLINGYPIKKGDRLTRAPSV